MEEDTITSKYGALMRSNTTFYVRDDALGGMCGYGVWLYFGVVLGMRAKTGAGGGKFNNMRQSASLILWGWDVRIVRIEK